MPISRRGRVRTVGPATRRRALLAPLLHFAALLLLTLALAFANARFGSLNLLPGDSLAPPALLLVAAYAWCLYRRLLRLGLVGPEQRRPVFLLTTVSTLLAAPVIGWLLVPAINGLVAAGPEEVSRQPVLRIEAQAQRHGPDFYYYAHLAASDVLPAGRYFMGRYAEAWAPEVGEDAADIRQVSVRYRRGILGARSLLEVYPDD